MLLPSAFVFTSLAITLPYLYIILRSPPYLNHPPLRTPLNILLLLHTLYITYTLLLKYPPNLFSRLNIPLETPTHKIRALLTAAGGGKHPETIEGLLTRLGSFEVRTLYVRFGHDTITSCTYCHTYYEYALFSLPTPLLQYIRTTCVLGLLTIRGSHRERWRRWGIALVTFAGLWEGWWISTVAIGVKDQGTVMWHDILWTIRHLFFLLLPPFFHILLPPSAPLPSPMQTLGSSLPQSLDSALTKLRLLKYTKGAIMRVPELREQSEDWWAAERTRGEWIREDDIVRRVAEKVGLGFDEGEQDAIAFPSGNEGVEGRLRRQARLAVQMLVGTFGPVEN